MPLRIVAVDNDEAALQLLLLDLGLEGHDVVATAMDGEQAVARVEQHQPDVLVVDLRLGPGMNGLDVIARVRRPTLRTVLFTNYVTPDVVSSATRMDAVVVEKGNLHALRAAVVGSPDP